MRICLICRKRNIDYYGICPECRRFSDSKRAETIDLSGSTAVVTGGRIKIGYAVCLRLLRQGAKVIAVTRYPKTAMEQYMKEPDYNEFSSRLSVIGFDLMRIDRIDELVNCIADISGGVVDILVRAFLCIKPGLKLQEKQNIQEDQRTDQHHYLPQVRSDILKPLVSRFRILVVIVNPVGRYHRDSRYRKQFGQSVDNLENKSSGKLCHATEASCCY